MKNYTLRFRAENKNIFDAILDGRKKVETRAGTIKYVNIKKGDTVTLSCGGKKVIKEIRKVKKYKTVGALLKDYKPSEVNPFAKTKKEIVDIYHSFPGYKEKITKFGLVAIEFKK